MTGIEILFYVVAFFAVTSAAGVVLFKNPIHCALSLVVTLFSLAAAYTLLHASFVAVIQILTYAGAILVLFVFIVMLLNLQPTELEERGYGKFLTLLLALVSLACLLGFGYQMHKLPLTDVAWVGPPFGSIQEIGADLFTEYVWPFEIAGVLLTVALVGAVLLAKRKLN